MEKMYQLLRGSSWGKLMMTVLPPNGALQLYEGMWREKDGQLGITYGSR
jgi:hypothetical protein